MEGTIRDSLNAVGVAYNNKELRLVVNALSAAPAVAVKQVSNKVLVSNANRLPVPIFMPCETVPIAAVVIPAKTPSIAACAMALPYCRHVAVTPLLITV